MKFLKALVVSAIVAPTVSVALADDFSMASELLVAAKNRNLQQVQSLIRNGANINYVDNTGLSLVCTAIKNNDMRTAQILQMYGADASNCDKQIKAYNTKNNPATDSGFFGGLTKPQGMLLVGAGTAAVVGGLFLLTDVFDADNGNGSSGSSGSGNNNNNNNNNNSSTGTAIFGTSGLPYGPATINASGETNTYPENLKLYYSRLINGADGTEPVENFPYYNNFLLMNANSNYLLLMRGYSPFARGYMGMRTLRNLDTHAPLLSYKNYQLGSENVEGGRPVNVALVTGNGVNAATGTSLQDKFLVWTSNNGTDSLNPASNYMVSSKYYNNLITLGDTPASTLDDTSKEDLSLLSVFDLSNSGTAIHNTLTLDTEDLIAKTVGGLDSVGPDFMGFMPNGQMTIYRTGNGDVMTSLETPEHVGRYVFAGESIATNDTFTNFLGDSWTVTVSGNGITLTSQTDEDNELYGYVGTDNLLYLDTDGDKIADNAYIMSDTFLTLSKSLTSADYYNYSALANALARRTDLGTNGDILNIGRSGVDIIANTNVIEPLHARDAATVSDVLSAGASAYETQFLNLVSAYYGNTSTENSLKPNVNALAFFNGLSSYPALTIFSTGASQLTTTGTALQIASFENAAPLAFSNLEHLFMSVVAVNANTSGVTAITPNSDSIPTSGSKYNLAVWTASNGNSYVSRTCGAIAGKGTGGIDPWCFSAVGLTDELATASAAGAAGVLKSAFYYMTPQQIFMLLALTADGPYLKTKSDGKTFSEDELIAHLTGMYEMPWGYQYRINNGENYLDVFKEVYGYGVINLERATKPTTNVYYFTNNKIVSTSGNSYWRSAMNTALRGSSAFNLGRAAINVAAYDVLESFDGSMRLPRIWESSFALGESHKHGLYMGDVLGDLKTRGDDASVVRDSMGNISFALARSERAYADNMNGLDNMRFEYANGDWTLGADYQHYLTNGKSRFFDSVNPVLGLASNAVTTDATYSNGRWSFGARAFSGAITDEGLLQNDPVVSSNYEPLKLGLMNGAESIVAWDGKKFGFASSVGMAHESNTLLGAASSGLLDTGAANTRYIDVNAYWKPSDIVRLGLRATFAHTETDMATDSLIRLTDLESNAFAFDAQIGNFTLGASLPLAVTRGNLDYSFADYEIIGTDESHYDLAITDYGTRSIDIAPEHREVRLTATYKHKFGEFTDGALGFVYRVNPNNTDEFGDEGILMMKLTHRLGI